MLVSGNMTLNNYLGFVMVGQQICICYAETLQAVLK